MRKCCRCNELKPFYEFNKSKTEKGGRAYACKVCTKRAVFEYRRTLVGLTSTIYNNQKQNSKTRGYAMPNYSLTKFREWAYGNCDLKILYNRWVDSGYDKRLTPSFDRIDDYKPYTFENMQLMTWAENEQKGNDDRKNGVNNKKSKGLRRENVLTGEVVYYYSYTQMSRVTGYTKAIVRDCCNGSRLTYKGCRWELVNY